MSTATTVRSTSRLREDNEHLLQENNSLKADIAYWKSRHRDAVAREKTLQKALEDREARIKYLTGQLYGRKRERSA
ncbi:MAG: hypothetical protein ACOCRN_02185, partial [Spirochaetia bacterium]